MQSVRRAIKRGNAVMAFDNVTKQVYVSYKKGTDRKSRSIALRDRMLASEDSYCRNVTNPLTHVMVRDSKDRRVFNLK